MKKVILSVCLFAISFIHNIASAQPDLPNEHAPIGVMGDHTHGKGGYLLSMMDMAWFSDFYFNDLNEPKNDLRASPILLEDYSGLPPALVITAGYDPLRDEGKHYADKLEAAGVDVDYVCFESTIHGFMSFSGALDAGKQALELAAQKLKQNLSL
jgi:acetyl esterase